MVVGLAAVSCSALMDLVGIFLDREKMLRRHKKIHWKVFREGDTGRDMGGFDLVGNPMFARGHKQRERATIKSCVGTAETGVTLTVGHRLKRGTSLIHISGLVIFTNI